MKVSDYYAPCKELDECNALIEQYWNTKRYELCFAGHLKLAEKGYPLAECQVGYFYLEGYGVQKISHRHFIGRNVPRSMVTAMHNSIWGGSMKMESLFQKIWKLQMCGIIKRQRSNRRMRWKN